MKINANNANDNSRHNSNDDDILRYLLDSEISESQLEIETHEALDYWNITSSNVENTIKSLNYNLQYQNKLRSLIGQINSELDYIDQCRTEITKIKRASHSSSSSTFLSSSSLKDKKISRKSLKNENESRLKEDENDSDHIQNDSLIEEDGEENEEGKDSKKKIKNQEEIKIEIKTEKINEKINENDIDQNRNENAIPEAIIPDIEQERKFLNQFSQDEWNRILQSYKDTLEANERLDNQRPWSSNEILDLTKAVRQQNQKIILRKAVETVQEGNYDKFVAYKSTFNRINGMNPEEFELDTKEIDWTEISNNYFGGGRRSPNECAIRWLYHEHPLINKEPWKREEINKLKELITKHDGLNDGKEGKDWKYWEIMANELKTNRTPLSCIMIYKQYLNRLANLGKWTRNEDDALRKAVDQSPFDDWISVQYQSGLKRSPGQCSFRWKKALAPWIRKGRWTGEENKRLEDAIQIHGFKDWNLISKYTIGRTDVQCRERAMNTLNPSIKQTIWTEQEDSLLIDLIKRHGIGHWSRIAEEISGRTDNQCSRRYSKLIKEKESPNPTSSNSNSNSLPIKKNEENEKRSKKKKKK